MTDQPASGYRYWAFISYSHMDAVHAKWLHRAIETYGIPAKLVEHGHETPVGDPAPKRFKPIFRDRDELPASADLSGAIKDALTASRYLIVVCSPNAAKSPWVNREIETFIEMGRSDRIFAHIMDGEPNSGDENTECFPPALRQPVEPLAADARSLGDGKNDAKLKLLAGMLGVGFDALKQREAQSRIRRLQLVVTGSLLLALVLGGLAWYANHQRGLADRSRQAAVASEENAVLEAHMRGTAEVQAQVARATAVSEADTRATAQVQAEAAATQEAIARQDAEEQKVLAISRKLAAQAEQLAPTAYDLALLLALQSSNITDTVESKAAILSVLNANPSLQYYLHQNQDDDALRAAVFRGTEQLIHLHCIERKTALYVDLDYTGCDETEIQLLDSSHRVEVLRSARLPGQAGAPVLSSDGSKLALARHVDGENYVTLFNVDDLAPIVARVPHNASSFVFEPSAKILISAGFDKAIRLWDTVTGQEIRSPLLGHNSFVLAIALSPDGKMLASGDAYGNVLLWDLESGQPLGTPLVDQVWPTASLAFSSDGRRILASGLPEVGPSTGLSAKLDVPNVIVWDLATRQVVLRHRTGSGSVKVALAPMTGALAIAEGNDISLLKDVEAPLASATKLRGHKSLVSHLAFSPDGTRLVSSGHRDTIMWNLSDEPRLSRMLSGHEGPIIGIAFNPDGTVLASGSWDGSVRAWSMTDGTLLHDLTSGHVNNVFAVAFSPDGKLLASAGFDGVIVLWDWRNGRLLRRLEGQYANPIMKIAFSPDSSTLVSSSINPDRTVVLWDVETGDVLKSVEVTSDILAYSEDEDSIFSTFGSFIRDLVFSSDGQSVYIIGNRLAYAKWNLASSSVDVIKTDANVSMPMSIAAAVQPNAGRVAIGVADGGVLLFDVSGKPVGKVDSSQTGSPHVIKISPAGDLLAVNSFKMFGADPLLGAGISLWDMKSVTSRGFIAPPTGSEFRSIAFSNSGELLAGGTDSGLVALWDLGLDSWQKQACRILKRNLSLTEWRQFVGESVAYAKTCPDLPVGQEAAEDVRAVPDSSSSFFVVPIPTSQSPLAGIARKVLPATTPTPRPASPALPQDWETDWSYEVAEMAPGLSAIQPYFVQCRGNAESAQATQEFMGLWAIRNEHKDQWVSGAGARLTIQGQTASSGTEYEGGISIGAGQDGWLMPNANILGRVMTSESGTTSKLVLSIADVNWEALRGDAGQYAYDVSIHGDATYGDANFPRHAIVLRVENIGKLPMKGVYFLAALQDGRGRTIDVLTQGIPPSSGIALMDRQGVDLAGGTEAFFVLRSHSLSGRCVGAAPKDGYRLHYWLNFDSDAGERVTQYYQQESTD